MFEELNDFKRTTCGGLSPQGELKACEYFEHSQLMGVKEYYDEIHAQYWCEADEIVHEEMEAAGNDYYHPEWHRFEIGDDTQQQAYMKAYNEGWVRLIFNPTGNMLYAESTRDVLNARKKDLKFIAECLDINCELKLSEQKVRTYW